MRILTVLMVISNFMLPAGCQDFAVIEDTCLIKALVTYKEIGEYNHEDSHFFKIYLKQNKVEVSDSDETGEISYDVAILVGHYDEEPEPTLYYLNEKFLDPEIDSTQWPYLEVIHGAYAERKSMRIDTRKFLRD